MSQLSGVASSVSIEFPAQEAESERAPSGIVNDAAVDAAARPFA
jgi:hypothetical protein